MTPLDLSLPEAPRRRGPRLSLAILGLVNLATLALVVWLVLARDSRSGPGATVDVRPAERLAELGRDLERRTLWDAAAGVWDEYLVAASGSAEGLAPDEAARTIYRRGINLQKAGRASEAARCFTEVTQKDGVGASLSSDERREAHRKLLECLSALGKEEARREALRAFTVVDREEASTTLARVGDDPITLESLRKEITETMLSALRATRPGAAPDALRAEAEARVKSEFANAESLRRILEEAITREILYREGLSRGEGAGADYEEAQQRFRRTWIGARVIESAAAKILEGISDTDLENHHRAHTDRFVAPETVEFSTRRHADRASAEMQIAALRTGTDDAAKADLIPAGRATSTGALPIFGDSAEARAAILALGEGEVLARPLQADGAWHVVRADRKTPARPLSLDESRDRVRADLASVKTRELLGQLRETLARKFRVELDLRAIDAATKGLGESRETPGSPDPANDASSDAGEPEEEETAGDGNSR